MAPLRVDIYLADAFGVKPLANLYAGVQKNATMLTLLTI